MFLLGCFRQVERIRPERLLIKENWHLLHTSTIVRERSETQRLLYGLEDMGWVSVGFRYVLDVYEGVYC